MLKLQHRYTASTLAVLAAFTIAACVQTAPASDTVESAEIATAPEQADRLETLAAFDDKNESISFSQEAASFTMNDTTGALDISFTDEAWYSRVKIAPDQPWDWSAYKDFNIALDVTNTGDVSVQVYVSVVDAHGKARNTATPIAVGETRTIYSVLDGMPLHLVNGKRENPPPFDLDEDMMFWRFGDKQIDFSQITEIGIAARGIIRPKSISVDNIRLRQNPPIKPDYLVGMVDEFGQSAKLDYPIKVSSESELKAAAVAELAELEANPAFSDRSRFGGWKYGPRFEATGYFRTQKVNNQWWLVDPEGYLFFSNGLANVRMANLSTLTGIDFADESIRYIDPNEVTPEDSIGNVKVSNEVRETRFVTFEDRKKMFSWLPDYNHPLADHYSYRRTTLQGPIKSGETYSFYRANVERRYGQTEPESYLRDWEQVTLDRMNSWGMTSFGNWVDPAFYPNEQVPYFANGWIIGDYKVLTSEHDHWAPMPDFFDPKFRERARATISVVAEEIQGSPWCIGIFIDNEKSWGIREGSLEQRYGIMLNALSRDAKDSPAKAHFMGLLKAKYETITAVNASWNVSLSSWEELAAGYELSEETEGLVEDLSMMLEAHAEKYFSIVDETLEEYLPNHIYMGARMANWGMPDEAIKASVKHSDVLSFNVYEEGLQENTWAFLKDIDLPTVIGEWHIGSASDSGLNHPGLVMATSQADRARMYKEYLTTVIEHPNFVGAHWFQYIDSPLTGRAFDGEPYNVGFVSGTDIPYPEMVAAAREINSELYTKRFGQTAE